MSKLDFTKALNSYEYYLRSSVNPNIDNFFFASVPTMKKTYFILALPNMLSLLQFYLNSSLQMEDSITNDPSVVFHKDCYGIFVYDEHFDHIYVCGNKDFKTGMMNCTAMIDNINDFIKIQQKNTITSGYGIQSNWASSVSTGVSLPNLNFSEPKIKPKCDCGAQKLGYKDSDEYGHAYWCSVMSQK